MLQWKRLVTSIGGFKQSLNLFANLFTTEESLNNLILIFGAYVRRSQRRKSESLSQHTDQAVTTAKSN